MGDRQFGGRKVAVNIIDKFDPSTEWNGSNGNWNKDRLRKVRGIAMHKTGYDRDTALGVVSWFHNRNSQVSSTYVVGFAGEIFRVIPEEYVSYATGGHPSCIARWKVPNGPILTGYEINRDTVSIEVLGASGGPYTPMQKVAVSWLVVDIAKRYAIPPECVFAHADVQADKHDGREYLTELRQAVKRGGDMSDEDFESYFFAWWVSGGVGGNSEAGIYQAIKDRVRRGEFYTPPYTDESDLPTDTNYTVQYGANWKAEYNKTTKETRIDKF